MHEDHSRVIRLVKQDQFRIDALECVKKLNLPQCYLAAGFVRNLVWDYLHQKSIPSPLNDIDVIYYDANEIDKEIYLMHEATLTKEMPHVKWQVRNQANMHIRNGDKPYKSTEDAMRYWPEKETAVAIRKSGHNHYECLSAFGFESLFNFKITYNPKRNRHTFEHRIMSKNWLTNWPKLNIIG